MFFLLFVFWHFIIFVFVFFFFFFFRFSAQNSIRVRFSSFIFHTLHFATHPSILPPLLLTTMTPHNSVLLLLVLCALSFVSAHNQLLAPWGTSCFYEDVKKGDQLAVTFQVGNRDPHSTDQLEIDFWVWFEYNFVFCTLSTILGSIRSPW